MRFAAPFTVLDGGLSTALELAGHDLDHELWTARLLSGAPTALVDAHLAYLRAGAEILITSSYQASASGLVKGGFNRSDALGLIGLTTELAREAIRRHADERGHEVAALVAASVGPFGATLADGSEYRGDYALDRGRLTEFHLDRLEVLVASEPDLLACETIPCIDEAFALTDALGELRPVPTWITFSCRDGARVSSGEPIEAAIAAATALPQVVAVGVNCTAPEHVGELLERAAAVTPLPLVAYANSGQQWDAAGNCWRGDPAGLPSDEQLGRWIAAGARLIGGCCGVSPAGIRSLRSWRDGYLPDGEAA